MTDPTPAEAAAAEALIAAERADVLRAAAKGVPGLLVHGEPDPAYWTATCAALHRYAQTAVAAARPGVERKVRDQIAAGLRTNADIHDLLSEQGPVESRSRDKTIASAFALAAEIAEGHTEGCGCDARGGASDG